MLAFFRIYAKSFFVFYLTAVSANILAQLWIFDDDGPKIDVAPSIRRVTLEPGVLQNVYIFAGYNDLLTGSRFTVYSDRFDSLQLSVAVPPMAIFLRGRLLSRTWIERHAWLPQWSPVGLFSRGARRPRSVLSGPARMESLMATKGTVPDLSPRAWTS